MPGFFASAALIVTTLSLLLASLDSLKGSASDAQSVMEWAKDEDFTREADEANNDDSVVTIDAKEAKAKPVKAKQASTETASAETLATIADICDDVLAFVLAFAVKYPRVLAAPL